MKSLLGIFSLSLRMVGVLAQTETASASGAVTTWKVNVGKADHKMEPDVVQANVGDIIEFNFFPPNHSIVRAEYLHPCVPFEKVRIGEAGFFSGFKPVSAVLSNPPTWQLTVNDTEPIFYYCSAPGSCINYEMVGVINPNSTTVLATHKAVAGNSSYMLQPGEDFPSEDDLASKTGSSATTSSATSSTSAVAATSSTAGAATESRGSSFPPGAIAGVVVGVVVIIALAAGLFYMFGRQRSMKKAQFAAASMLGSNGGGQASPNIPPTAMNPVYGAEGMVYVPVKTSDLHRYSTATVAPMGGPGPDMMSPQMGNNGRFSPDHTQNPHRSSTHSPQMAPVEVYAGPNP